MLILLQAFWIFSLVSVNKKPFVCFFCLTDSAVKAQSIIFAP